MSCVSNCDFKIAIRTIQRLAETKTISKESSDLIIQKINDALPSVDLQASTIRFRKAKTISFNKSTNGGVA